MSKLSLKEKKIVGSPLNFRGLVYGPINEQGVVYLFGLIANDLNIRVESIQQGYPDCTAIKYAGDRSIDDHDPDKCDVLVCWEDDLPEGKRESIKGLQIYELKTLINTPEVPNIHPKDPEESSEEEAEYDLEYHFSRKNVNKDVQTLFVELDKRIRDIDESIWLKFAQTAITYYSPEKTFVYLTLRKNSLALDVYTGQKKIEGVQNIKNHENWGALHIRNKNELEVAILAIEKSFGYIREAIKNNENTGWYALTPKNK
jgi:predicted transport protein